MEEFICRYPFDVKKFKVKILKPRGDFAHENFPESRYAVDFELPLGTPVLAVRKGIVILTKHDSDGCYPTSKVRNLTVAEMKELVNLSTNLVGIDHRNGIFTEYAHLAKDQVVSREHSVEKGEVIGYIGKSGLMNESHLHFNACKIENRKGISIPVKFYQVK